MRKGVVTISSYTAALSCICYSSVPSFYSKLLISVDISPVSLSFYLSHPSWKLQELVDALKGILYANAAVYCTYPTGRLTLTQRTFSGLGTRTPLQPSRPPTALELGGVPLT